MHGLRVELRATRQALVYDHAHQRHAECRADRASELGERRRGAHRPHRDCVLDHEHEHLHHEPEPDPRDDHVPRGLGIRRRGIHARQEEEPRPEDDRPGDRVRPVTPAPRDPLP